MVSNFAALAEKFDMGQEFDELREHQEALKSASRMPRPDRTHLGTLHKIVWGFSFPFYRSSQKAEQMAAEFKQSIQVADWKQQVAKEHGDSVEALRSSYSVTSSS